MKPILNIVVPMAGRGSRFAQAGFLKPKPLILLGGIPMIQWVINNVRPRHPHRFIFVCLHEHLVANPEVPETLRRLCPGCIIVEVKQVTEGAACTVLLAREHIDNDDPLMIANSDQYVELPIGDYLSAMDDPTVSGLIMTFWADHPKWSYCAMRADRTVAEVVEKKVISNEATVGIYNFRRGRDFVAAAEEMIRRNLRVNNEFYVAPTYNLLIARGDKIVVRETGREYAGMYGLGTPDDYEFFQTTSQFRKDCPVGHVSPLFRQRPRLEKLSQFYFQFLNCRNRAGLEALLQPDATRTDSAGRIVGREAILNWAKELFGVPGEHEIKMRNLLIDGDMTVIDFDILAEGRRSAAVELLTWRGDKIACVRSFR